MYESRVYESVDDRDLTKIMSRKTAPVDRGLINLLKLLLIYIYIYINKIDSNENHEQYKQ